MDKLWYLVVLAVLAGGSYVAYTSYQTKIQNDALEALYASVAGITTYVQEVETDFSISDRKVAVVGRYVNNRGENLYASYATTTLMVPGEDAFSFSLSNIAVGDTLYLKLEKISGSLPSAAPMGPTWHRFTEGTIPPEFEGIAAFGPILDSLALLRNNGKSLTLIKSIKNDESFGDPLTRFVYSMAPAVRGEEAPVSAVRERLTGAGTVSVWTDASVTSVRYLVLQAPGYSSTTTIESVNIPVPVSLPN